MIKVVAGLIVAVSLAGAVDREVQRAIAWERHKEQAAARQAARERRHPSVTYNNANRSSEPDAQGQPVKDPGPKPSPDKGK